MNEKAGLCQCGRGKCRPGKLSCQRCADARKVNVRLEAAE